MNTELDWRKSSYSFANGNCVTIAAWRKSARGMSNRHCAEAHPAAGGILVRDSKNPGLVIPLHAKSWREFITALKDVSVIE